MKILYVMPNITHPTIRGELRHYHFLQRLAKRHEITLLVLNRAGVPEAVIDEVRQYTRHLAQVGPPLPPRPGGRGIAGIVAVMHWQVRKLQLFHRAVAEMKQYVERLVRAGGFDLVLLSGSGLHGIAEELADGPLVVDWCDTDSVRLRRALRHTRFLEWPWRYMRYQQTRRIERRLFRKLRNVTFISRRDRDAASGRARRGTVIPNGCDLTYWRRRSSTRGQRIVFTGVLDYPPNADAAEYLLSTVMPLVRRQIPDVEVVVAGRNPSSGVRALARKFPGVMVTGGVPDLRPYLESAAVFVAPLRFASGMQNKILEAMAMELPVVTTPAAAAGFSTEGDDPPLLVGEDATELAAHIASVMRDPQTARRLGAEGRRYVQSNCDWEQSARMLDRLCRDVALTQRAGADARTFDSRGYQSASSTRSKDRVFHSLV
jgi:glycosyltransferase involved in cell wall biosynthesis